MQCPWNLIEKGLKNMREMNLLPEEHLHKLEQERKIRKYVILISLIVFSMIISYLSFYFIGYGIRKEISSIKLQIESLGEISNTQIEVSINQEVLDHRINMLKVVEGKRMDHYQFISQLEKTIPDEIILESLTYSSGKHFNMRGRTTKPDEVADFMTNIAKIKGVENVFLDHIHFGHSEGQQESTPDFNINFTYQAEKGEQSDDFKQ